MDHSENDKRFYVYVHRDSCGNIVYVGHGTGNRAYTKSTRSNKHKTIFDTISIEITHNYLSKSEALLVEQEIYDNNKLSGFLLNTRRPSAVANLKYDFISEYLYYDESSKTFIRWRKSNNRKIKIGNEAGYLDMNRGYYHVELLGTNYSVHRIIYCLMNKMDVPNNLVIDHIDNNPSNNTINNLRLVTQSVNNCNRRTFSGCEITGVKWCSYHKKWYCRWSVNGHEKTKTFNHRVIYPDLPLEEAKQKAFEDAVAFRKQMEELYYK